MNSKIRSLLILASTQLGTCFPLKDTTRTENYPRSSVACKPGVAATATAALTKLSQVPHPSGTGLLKACCTAAKLTLSRSWFCSNKSINLKSHGQRCVFCPLHYPAARQTSDWMYPQCTKTKHRNSHTDNYS